MMLGKPHIHMKKNKVVPFPLSIHYTIYKKLKCIKDLNVRAVPTKPAEGANFCDLILDNGV